MIRGTTPTHTFTFTTINPSELSVLNIYYAQQGEVILEKNKSDCSFESSTSNDLTTYTASVTLSQEDTKKFNAKLKEVEVQLRVLTADNKSLASPKYKLPIHNVLNDEDLEL